MRRYLTFLVSALLLFSFSVHAADPLCYEYKNYDGSWTRQPETACQSFVSSMQSSFEPGFTVTYTGFNAATDVCAYVVKTPLGANFMSQQKTLVRRTVACEQVCEAGTKKTLNFTSGYHATPSTNAKLNPVIKADPFFKRLQKDQGATMCYEGCKIGVPPAEDGDFWISQVAGPNGLYRSSADIETMSTSQRCTEAAPDSVTSGTTPPVCPGTTGSVNGATVCLPSTTDSGVDMGGEATRGNPSAGPVDPTKTPSERAAGPGGAGNGSGTGGASNGGAASGGPATGSNNTPGGKGCNDGTKSPTPACSGKGELDADGNTDKPEEGKEQAACGAPGQPKCRIDETGTPGEVGGDKYDSKLDAYKNDSKDAADQIKGSGTGIYDSWTSLFVAPPLASCEGFEFPAHAGQSMGTVDPCNVVDGIRTAMAYLWAIGGFWLCLGWVKQANT